MLYETFCLSFLGAAIYPSRELASNGTGKNGPLLIFEKNTKTCGRVEVESHQFLTSVLDRDTRPKEESSPAALSSR